jgi:hypothetical protein
MALWSFSSNQDMTKCRMVRLEPCGEEEPSQILPVTTVPLLLRLLPLLQVSGVPVGVDPNHDNGASLVSCCVVWCRRRDLFRMLVWM